MPLTVVFFPSLDQLSGNPYWMILNSALADAGVEYGAGASPGFGRRWLWANRDLIDILHFHYVQHFYAYERTGARLRWVLRFARNLLLARQWGYRTVFTLHNLTPTYPLRPAWVDYLGHWVVARLVDSVVVHCEFARWALAARFGRRRGVVVIPHPHLVGVYPNLIDSAQARSRLGLNRDEKVFTFFGGIRPNKGLVGLITAFRALDDRNFRLVIAGKPCPPASHLQELADLARPDDRIKLFADLIPDDEVQVYLKAADVVVLPFTRILTSSSAVLAMSFGRAPVLPRIGCLPELVAGDAGILYDPHDPEALIRVLRESIESDLQGMGQLAMNRVQELSWSALAAQTLAAYHGN